MAKAEIVCFLHMGNEFEEVESGKLSLRYHVGRLSFSLWRCIFIQVLSRETEPTRCVCVCREGETERVRFILKNWLMRLWRLSPKSNGVGLRELGRNALSSKAIF